MKKHYPRIVEREHAQSICINALEHIKYKNTSSPPLLGVCARACVRVCVIHLTIKVFNINNILNF